jgi:2'-5' RNA ligase
LPERYNFFYRSYALGLSSLVEFFMRQVKLKIIQAELTSAYDQALTQEFIRAFISVDIPIDFSRVKNYVKKYLDSNLGSPVFIPEENQHLTLIFLGTIESKYLENIFTLITDNISELILAEKAKNRKPLEGFYLTIHNNLFGIRKKVIVFDLKTITHSGIDFLATLHDRLKNRLFPYASAMSTLNFIPHITIGTVKTERLNIDKYNQLLNFLSTINPPVGARGPRHIPSETFNIKSITLYQSSQSGKHIPLARWHLI